jgi:CRISPR-associated protein Csx16
MRKTTRKDFEMEDILIVSRHPGAVEWLKLHGVTGEVVPHVDNPQRVVGRVVYGVLPLHLAALAQKVVAIDLPGLQADQRGKDLTPEEMDAAGAVMSTYRVRRVE